eukprot:scaffold387_cov195-Alexandrium_tamarense.AAC.33
MASQPTPPPPPSSGTQPAAPDSILQRLQHNALHTPNKPAICFLQTNGNCTPSVASPWTYNQLNSAVEHLASRLLPSPDTPPKSRLIPSPYDLSKGDRILLVYPPCSPHFLVSFLACLRSGLVAVPTYPPHPGRKDSLASFAGIARGCGARVALTNGEYASLKRLGELRDAFWSKVKSGGRKRTGGDNDNHGEGEADWPEELMWVVTDGEPLLSPPQKTNDDQSLAIPQPSDIAFLQYTSGSTSAPKGVTITHSNLAHNLAIITNDLNASDSTIVVSWLPQYHDMGLIGSLLGIIYCGGIITGHSMAKKEHVINGAEPVSESSIDAFVDAFRPFGLPDNPSVIYPTYGLAEHTVFVCSGGKGRLTVMRRELEEENKVVIVSGSEKPDGTMRLLGCGFPARQCVNVQIVDPDKRISLGEDTVGEIWINSPSKAMRYFGKDDVTREEFHAVLASDSSSACDYLRSGDLGFLHGGELYICGRLKDLVIVGGRNYYPQDLEAAAESISSDHVRPGCSAVFSINSSTADKQSNSNQYGGEDVILVMELKEPLPKAKDIDATCKAITEAVRSEISKEFSLPLSCIVLLKTRTVPKTTSGKISRSRARKAYLDGSLLELYRKKFNSEESSNGVSQTGVLSSITATPSPTLGSQTTPVGSIPSSTAIRSLDKQQIKERLVATICQIANIDKDLVADTAPLNTIMDSVSLAQLKGMLEGQCSVSPFSDEYLFRDTTTLKKLVEIVQLGHAPDDVSASAETGANENVASSSSGVGSSGGGLAGALGCPPGVVCCTVM